MPSRMATTTQCSRVHKCSIQIVMCMQPGNTNSRLICSNSITGCKTKALTSEDTWTAIWRNRCNQCTHTTVTITAIINLSLMCHRIFITRIKFTTSMVIIFTISTFLQLKEELKRSVLKSDLRKSRPVVGKTTLKVLSSKLRNLSSQSLKEIV